MTSCSSSTGSRRRAPGRAVALILLLLLVAATSPVTAVYSMNGIPLKTVAHAQHHGSVSVMGGHGLVASPYAQSFTVPSGTVRFARLYVGVWGGTPEYKGTVETSFNGVSLGERSLGGGQDSNSLTHVSGFGVHWCAYDVRERVVSGTNTATATTAGEIDGRVYGIVLAVATEDPSAPEVEYWFAEGNENLNKDASKDSVSLSLGPGPSPAAVSDARMFVTYVASVRGDGDTLLFNGKTVATDAAGASGGAYFDLRSYDVRSLVQSSNTVGFGRGNANRLHPTFVAYVCTLKPTTTATTTVTARATPAPAPTSPTSVATAAVDSTRITGTISSPTPVRTPVPTSLSPAVTRDAGETPVIIGSGQGGVGLTPESSGNASSLSPQEGGAEPLGSERDVGFVESGVTNEPIGHASSIVLFALIVGAGVIVFSVCVGTSIRCYRRLSRRGDRVRKDTQGLVDPAQQSTLSRRFNENE